LTSSHETDVNFDIFLKVVNHFLDGDRADINNSLVVDGVRIWDGFCLAHGDWVVIFRFDFVDLSRLREQEQRKSQVNKSVFDVLDSSVALDELEDFSSDGTGDHGSGGGDGWDDLSSNHLSLLFVRNWDLIIGGSQVGTGVDEGDMEVVIIIFFELCSTKIFFFDFFFKSFKLCL